MASRPRRLPYAGGKKRNSASKPGGTNAGPTLVWTGRAVPPGTVTAAVAATEAAAVAPAAPAAAAASVSISF